MRRILMFAFAIVFLFFIPVDLSATILKEIDIDAEKTYLSICESPERIGSLDLKQYDLEVNWGHRFLHQEGMCWFPGKGVVQRYFGMMKQEEINGRLIKIVVTPVDYVGITVDLPSVDHIKKVVHKLVPVSGYVHWKTNHRFLVMYVTEIYVHSTDGRILCGYRDRDWNGNLNEFRKAKLKEEVKYFK